MSLEDILTIDTCPVDEEILHGVTEVASSNYTPEYLSVEQWVHFLLFYRYIEKFVAVMEVSISLPAVNYCLSKEDGSVKVGEYVAGWRTGDFARGLFIQVMAECNWQYSVVTYTGEEWMAMPETETCKSAEWKSVVRLAVKMKETLQPDYHNAKYHIYWNYHLAWYLQFKKRYPQKIKMVFSEGDKKIEELLKKTGSPLCMEEDFHMLDEDKYLLGLIEGGSGKQCVNFKMLDYMILIRLVVLDRLLKYARELFEAEKEGKM